MNTVIMMNSLGSKKSDPLPKTVFQGLKKKKKTVIARNYPMGALFLSILIKMAMLCVLTSISIVFC